MRTTRKNNYSKVLRGTIFAGTAMSITIGSVCGLRETAHELDKDAYIQETQEAIAKLKESEWAGVNGVTRWVDTSYVNSSKEKVIGKMQFVSTKELIAEQQNKVAHIDKHIFGNYIISLVLGTAVLGALAAFKVDQMTKLWRTNTAQMLSEKTSQTIVYTQNLFTQATDIVTDFAKKIYNKKDPGANIPR